MTEECDVLQYLIKGCESLNPTQPDARADLSQTGANISDFRFQLSYLGQASGPLDLSLTGIEEETCIDFLKLRGVLLLIWAASSAWWKCLECLYFFKQLWAPWQLCFLEQLSVQYAYWGGKRRVVFYNKLHASTSPMKVMLMASRYHNTSRLGSVCEGDSCWRRFD